MIENYIQYLEGYNKDNITFSDIEKAIIEINETDDEHSVFWVSVISDDDFENVIETSKSLDLIITFDKKVILLDNKLKRDSMNIILDE